MQKNRSVSEKVNGQHTALSIIAHALYQRKRGRGPSESYLGEKNPRKALALALKELEMTEFPGVEISGQLSTRFLEKRWNKLLQEWRQMGEMLVVVRV